MNTALKIVEDKRRKKRSQASLDMSRFLLEVAMEELKSPDSRYVSLKGVERIKRRLQLAI